MTSTKLTFTDARVSGAGTFIIPRYKKCFKNETFPLAEGRFVVFFASS